MSHHIGSSSMSLSSSRHVAHVSFSLIFTYLPFYFNLSFPVFFLSSVLMHPDLHTDLYDQDSVQNNLRHSAKGSLDAYDVTHSLTSNTEVPADLPEEPASQSSVKVVAARSKAKAKPGLTFYQTRSNAVILQGTLPAHCIPKVVRLKTGVVLYEKSYHHLRSH